MAASEPSWVEPPNAALGRALIDQARLGDVFERAVGTSSEQSAFERLQRAGREVTRCDRVVRHESEGGGPPPS